MTRFRPNDAQELRDIVAWAAAEEQPLEIVGAGTKRALGRPLQVEHTVELGALSGIRDYEPSELVLTAAAATPLAAIERALAEAGQMLAFEPPDWSGLLDGKAAPGGETLGGQTLGGVISCNLAGPRRLKAGAARDHFLGFAAVNGRGEIFKAGGRVVKNVTGYDLCKLMAGAHGTLAALTEATVKVLPRPEKARTVLVFGLSNADAIRALAQALNSPHEVSGAAHLPAPAAARSGVSYVGGAATAVTAVRLEGPGPSVDFRCRELRQALAGFGATEELHSANSAALWREIGEAALFVGAAGRVVWRVAAAPTGGPAVAAVAARQLDADYFFDWGGGLVWLGIGGAVDGGAAVIREALREAGGGHATVIRAPEPLRAALDVFEPLPPPLASLTSRVKESFDPRRIFNPGRMYRGV